VVGFTVLGIGVAMLVLPGPALLVIPIGLAVLGTEFVWAKRWLQRVRSLVSARKQSSPEKLSRTSHEEARQGASQNLRG
jgi:hypothetical protein